MMVIFHSGGSQPDGGCTARVPIRKHSVSEELQVTRSPLGSGTKKGRDALLDQMALPLSLTVRPVTSSFLIKGDSYVLGLSYFQSVTVNSYLLIEDFPPSVCGLLMVW